jgi:hypothetical protein
MRRISRHIYRCNEVADMPLESLTLETCYEPLPAPEDRAAVRELEPDLFERWAGLVAERGPGGMLTSLVLKLTRLAQAPLDLRLRLQVLLRLLPVIGDLADALPPPRVADPQARGQEEPLSLEQRLWCLVYRVLAQTLEWVDGPAGGELRDRDLVRLWLVTGQFEALGRLMELAQGGAHAIPPGSWQQAHDLYVYHLARVHGIPDGHLLEALNPSLLPPEVAYRRLLLFAVIIAAGRQELIDGSLRAPALVGWARESGLHDPGSYFGALGTYLVELSADGPPRHVPGPLGEVNRSLVLELPDDLRQRLRSSSGRL